MAIRKRGKNYQIYFYSPMIDGERKMITKTVASLEIARQTEKIMKAEFAKLPFLENNDKAQLNLHKFFDYWLKNYAEGKKSYNTIKLYHETFKRIDAALGHKKINSIKPTHIMQFYQNLQECCRLDNRKGKLSDSTIKKHHILLNMMFSSAVKWQIIYDNPVKHVEAPMYHYKNAKIILQEEELRRLLKLLGNEPVKHQLWIFLALGMGLRKGEIFGLKWKSINFEKKIMDISTQSLYSQAKGILANQTLKTNASIRKLSMPEMVLDLLAAYRGETLDIRRRLSNKWEGAESADDDMIFTTTLGKPAHPDSFSTWLRRFVDKHKLPAISPHSFRHMSASYLIAAGVDLTTVAGRLGHNNSTTTQVVYAHLLHSAEHKSAEVMNNILRNQKD